MNYPIFFYSQNSTNLYGLKKKFEFISSLYHRNKLPKVLMFSGTKGTGKSTLVNHFLYSIFDDENYDKDKLIFLDTSKFSKQFKNNIFSNIIYIKGESFNTIKIEDIRNLKTKILQSTISNTDRFIIFDDIELFNKNSLNALLKIIEEPAKKNYFFLINNKTRPILETIKSRTLEIKIILNEKERLEIINKLLGEFEQEIVLDPKNSQLSPGNFIKFNYICKEYNISLTNDFIKNFSLLLNLHKKNKDILFINILYFMVDYFFKNINNKNLSKNNDIYAFKDYVFENLNNYVLYNMNQNSIINAVSAKFNYE